MSGSHDPQIFLLPVHLGGTKSAADNSADYRLSQAAFMKSRKTRWSALIPKEELDPEWKILMENVGWDECLWWSGSLAMPQSFNTAACLPTPSV